MEDMMTLVSESTASQSQLIVFTSFLLAFDDGRCHWLIYTTTQITFCTSFITKIYLLMQP